MLTRPGQIELRNLIIGPGTRYPIDEIEGLGSTEVRRSSTDKPADDGVTPAAGDHGTDRQVLVHFGIAADDADHLADLLDAMLLAWTPVATADATVDATYWRAGARGQQIMRVRPGRCAHPQGFWEAHGQTAGVAELWMPDPYLYAVDEDATAINLAAGVTNVNANIDIGGTGRTRPIVEITGPARNPAVSVLRPDGTTRAIRFDIDVAAAQTFVVDVAAKRITLAGARRMDARAPDHQWPDLQPGVNQVTFTRSAVTLTGAQATANIRRRDAWRG